MSADITDVEIGKETEEPNKYFACSQKGTPSRPGDHVYGRYDAILCCPNIPCCLCPDYSCWIYHPTWEAELDRQVFFTWTFAILTTIIFLPTLWFKYEFYTFLLLIGIIPGACLLGSIVSSCSFHCYPIHVWTLNQR